MLRDLKGKLLIQYTIERLVTVVDEVIVVVRSDEQRRAFSSLGVKVVTDRVKEETPLAGAYTGLLEARGQYAFVTGGDYPLLNACAIELLFKEVMGHEAATPSWPDGWVEPLHAVYRAESSTGCALRLLDSGEKRMRMVLRNLNDVKFVPIDAIQRFDPELYTLFDVDTMEDLEKVRRIISLLGQDTSVKAMSAST